MARVSQAGVALATLGVGLAGVAPGALAAPSVDGSFPVVIALEATLAGLHPDAVGGAWLCSARAMSRPAIDAAIARINALSGQAALMEFGSALEYRAHYLGQQATAQFAVTNGASASNPSITIKVARDDLIDPTTKRAIDQPAVMVGCWLHLTNAAGQSVVTFQVAKPNASVAPPAAMAQVTSRPYFLASASIPNE